MWTSQFAYDLTQCTDLDISTYCSKYDKLCV